MKKAFTQKSGTTLNIDVANLEPALKGVGTETFVNAMAWRTEMCMPLFRACGLLQESMYFPDRPSDLGAVVRLIQPHSDFASLLSACGQPATEEQLMDGADLIYRMDWACVDALIHKTEITGGLNYDVVVEQHKGFNWMIGAYDAENWDTVKPHT